MAKRPHVMVVALGAQGHLNPLLHFVARLAAKGLCVTLASTHNARKQVLNAQTNHLNAAAEQGRIHIESFSDGIDSLDDQQGDFQFYIKQVGMVGPRSLTELILRLATEGRPVSCLVNNPFVPWVIDVGNQLQIPCATLWIQSCAVYAVYYRHYHKLTRFHEAGSDQDLMIPGLPPLKGEDLPSFMLPDNPHRVLYDLIVEQLEKMKNLRWVFANSVKEFELDVIESLAELPPMRPVGPLVPFALLNRPDTTRVRADMWETAPDCLEWLDGQPDNSVIYVSLGSFYVPQADQMKELAWGLKNSMTRFLWVVKLNPAQPNSGLPDGFLEETSGQGRVVSWSPQTDVLKHRAIAGFLTHCGWNSVLETLCAGVPVIAFPQWTDQPTNAKYLVDVYRVGLRLQVGSGRIVTREEVQRCIGELMAGERAAQMRQNALRWKGVMQMAAQDGGSSNQNIQEFVDELVSMDPIHNPNK